MNRKSSSRFVFVVLFSAWVFCQLAVIPVRAQSDCQNVINDAKNLHENGRFSDAIVRLNSCEKDIPKDQRIGAYRLLAMCYIEEDYENEARTAVRKIYKIDRNYKADPAQDPVQYQEIVVDERPPERLIVTLTKGWRKAYWVGVLAILSYFAYQKLSDSPDRKSVV